MKLTEPQIKYLREMEAEFKKSATESERVFLSRNRERANVVDELIKAEGEMFQFGYEILWGGATDVENQVKEYREKGFRLHGPMQYGVNELGEQFAQCMIKDEETDLECVVLSQGTTEKIQDEIHKYWRRGFKRDGSMSVTLGEYGPLYTQLMIKEVIRTKSNH